MSFTNSLALAKQDERYVASVLMSRDSVEAAIDTEEMISSWSDLSRRAKRAHQLEYGDIQIRLTDGRTRYVEVKTDRSAAKTGNLFLETLSDNGERTGCVTLGWFDNPECSYDIYAFNLIGVGVLVVNKRLLDKYIEPRREQFKTVSMRYDQTQMNRSEGLLVPWKDILDHVPSAKLWGIH